MPQDLPQDLPSRSKNFLKLQLTVTGARPDVDLDTPLWAFNRTRLRSKWLYGLYMACVLGPVRKVGAQAHFLGLAYESMASDPELDRNELLLTMYPSAGSFLDLLTGVWFEVLNLTIGTISVSDRQLGFAERIDDGPPPPEEFCKYRGDDVYLGHFYRAEKNLLPEARERLEEAAAAVGAGVYFMTYVMGMTEAQISMAIFVAVGVAMLWIPVINFVST